MFANNKFMSNLMSTNWLTTLINSKKKYISFCVSFTDWTINGKKKKKNDLYYNHHHMKSFEKKNCWIVEPCVNIEISNNNHNHNNQNVQQQREIITVLHCQQKAIKSYTTMYRYNCLTIFHVKLSIWIYHCVESLDDKDWKWTVYI